ncbi:MAG: hypothetical protein U0166_05395 [Acidobacteriota bacterium]
MAAGLTVAAAFAISPEESRALRAAPRVGSFEATLAAAGRVERDRALELVVLGDSRALKIDAPAIAKLAGLDPTLAINAASISGDWVTSYAMFRALEPHMDAQTVVLVGVSEYWLEGGASAFGLLPARAEYFDLGTPLLGIGSFFPVNTVRGERVAKLRRRAEMVVWRVRSLVTGEVRPASGNPNTDIGPGGLALANVDLWFAPIDDGARRRLIRMGDRFLASMSGRARRTALVELPNPAVRDDYVAAHYPGRRERFDASLRSLSARRDIAIIDLRSELPDKSFYEDFHHLGKGGVERVSELLAPEVRRLAPGGPIGDAESQAHGAQASSFPR